jgi:hypothetical protein
MNLRVTYKHDLSDSVGKEAAARWTDEIETDDPTSAIAQLIKDVESKGNGHTIMQVLIRGDELA